MESTNPVYILPRAWQGNQESIAQDLSASVHVGVGQFCAHRGLVFLEASDEEVHFRTLLAEKMGASDPGVMLTKGIRDSYNTGIENLTKVKGVRVLAEGKKETSACYGSSYLLHAPANTFLEEP